MLRSTLLAFVLGAASVGLAACGEATSGPSAGTDNLATKSAEAANPNTYVAAKYGITATAPDGWFVMDSAVTKKLMDVGRDTATANITAEEKAAFDASMDRSENIFGFLETDPKAAPEGGSGILALAEDVSSAPEVTNGREYFGHLREAFTSTGANVTIDDTYGSVQIDGHAFDTMNIVMHGTDAAGQPIQVKQRYIAAKHDTNMIVLIQSYVDDNDMAALDGIVSSMKLDWK